MRGNACANTIHLQYSSVNLASREFKADPFPYYAHLRAEQPVCRVSVPLMPGVNEAWLITPYDDVVAVLKDSRFAKSRLHASKKPWLPGAMEGFRHGWNLDGSRYRQDCRACACGQQGRISWARTVSQGICLQLAHHSEKSLPGTLAVASAVPVTPGIIL